MAEHTDVMVLRSIHLPQDMDDDLRGLAFALGCAKADLLRFFLNVGMASLGDWRSWDTEAVEHLAHAVQERGASESVKEGIRCDIARLGREP